MIVKLHDSFLKTKLTGGEEDGMSRPDVLYPVHVVHLLDHLKRLDGRALDGVDATPHPAHLMGDVLHAALQDTLEINS